MSENRSDPSEPIWDLEDFLGEEAEDLRKEMQDGKEGTSSTTPDGDPGTAGSTYEMADLIEEGASAENNDPSSWVPAGRRLIVLTLLFIAAASVYVVRVQEGQPTNVYSQETSRPLSASEVRSWIEQCDHLEATLSEAQISIQSSSLLGFSTELRTRPDLERAVSDGLSGMELQQFRFITRSMGNTMKVMGAESVTAEGSSTGSRINQNRQLLQEHREEISAAWQRLRKRNRNPTPAQERTASPVPVDSNPSSSGSPEIKSSLENGPK